MEPKRILVVDDEHDLCDILCFNLKANGYEAEAVNKAEDALQLISSQKAKGQEFDLVLLDIMMPGMSGLEMARQLKADKRTVHLPIIFLTAKSAEEDMLEGFQLGADDYVTKPFSVREVLARVKAVLNRSQAFVERDEGCMSYDGLQIDLGQKATYIDGTIVSLTKTEFELLALFLSHRGRVFTREELLEKVWRKGVVVTNRTVDVNITRMRKKIGRFSSCIITRQGFGYVFEEKVETRKS